jgi:hypothetical protein
VETEEKRSEKGTISWTDWRDKEQTRPVNWTLDIRDHQGEPGWAMLAIAANTHLSVADLLRLLSTGGVERSRSWIGRRRWLFSKLDAINNPGAKPNKDGKDPLAIDVMRANPTLSVRQLVRALSEHGITRKREWVRQHRCT